MVMETTFGRMAANTRAATNSTKSMALEPTPTLTVASIAVNGLMACSMALDVLSALKAPMRKKVFGPSVN